MDVVIEKGNVVREINKGDLVRVDFATDSVMFVAVRHPAVDKGRLTLVGLNGDQTQGIVRGSDMTLQAFLKTSRHVKSFEVFPKEDYELSLKAKK